MQFRKVTIAAGALVVAGALGTGAYELTSGGDHANPANPAAATTSSPDNGGTTGTTSSGGATLTQGGGVTSGSASHGTMSGSQQTPPPPPPKPKGLLDNPVAKKIATTQVYK
jgi:hypothetical protein